MDDGSVPTLHRQAGYAIRFRANDRGEPPHVHIEGNGGDAKFWLSPPKLANSAGYNRRQVAQIAEIVDAHRNEFLSRWHEYFD